MIQLYTGQGKGKTTAAIGQAVRAAGREYDVVFAQFMKGGDSGELHVMSEVENIKIMRSEKEFGFYHTLSVKEKEELTKIHNKILDALLEFAEEKTEQKEDAMIILDEVTYPLNWKLLDEGRLQKLLEYGKMGVEIVMTGRDAESFLTKCADYITEMKCLRHPYETGISARKGIEY